jgi:hypothetical protein
MGMLDAAQKIITVLHLKLSYCYGPRLPATRGPLKIPITIRKAADSGTSTRNPAELEISRDYQKEI